MVLIDYDCEDEISRSQVIWVGDNLRKDVALGRELRVKTLWAAYGAKVDPAWLTRLADFSPPENIARHAALDPASKESPTPDFVMQNGFSDLLDYLRSEGT